ncbi:MAG TPA: PQQ-binding-like beta-propeller repeat protein [Bryobacteraceae bacterium]|nr:PQQ-binding-like beta-propeller repeat protein [Bryobacteraceae bacterium]
MKDSSAIFLIAATMLTAGAATPDGEALYKQRCGICHDTKGQARMPTREEISQRTPEFVYRAMFEGPMMVQSAGISGEEGRAIARFLTGKEFSTAVAEIGGKCPGAPGPVRITDSGWNGWGNDPANTRYQPKPGLTAADVPKLKLKWAFGFAGEIVRSAQPTVIGDRVFVGSSSGEIYSLDAARGCVYWRYDAGATVRTAISVGKVAGRSGLVAYFGDTRSYVHAVDAASGKALWKVQVEDHPSSRITGAPAFYNGRLYVPVSSIEEATSMMPSYECCKFRGSVVALDGATGKQIWKSFSVTDPPKPYKSAKGAQQWGPAGAAIWSSPTIDVKKKVLYAATGNSYTDVSVNTSNAILAFDLETGSLLWASQVLPKDNFTMGCGRGANCPSEPGPDLDFGSSPILRELPGGKRVLVAGQKAGILWGLDPDQRGKVLWQTRLGKGSALGGIEWGHSADEQNAYAAISDLLGGLPGLKPGGIHAVKLDTGEKIWSTPAPELHCAPGSRGCTGAQSAAISSMPGVVFSGSVDGHFRAYSTKTGEIIWDFNTVQDFETVNRVPGKGGSIDSAGPTIANGMVFTNSGYGQWQGLPGNVLLAFSVDGK